MAVIVKDRVYETNSATGTGDFIVTGAVDSSYVTYASVCANNDTFHYCAVDDIAHAFEIGAGTYITATKHIVRSNIEASSNAGALVSFANPPKIFLTASASSLVSAVTGGTFGQFAMYNSSTTVTGMSLLTYLANGRLGIALPTDDLITTLQVNGSIKANTSISAQSASFTLGLPLSSGGTGATTASQARNNLQISQVAFVVDFSQGAIVTNGIITVVRNSPFAFTVSDMGYEVGSAGGSFTVAVNINATPITGLSAVVVSSATQNTANATAARTVAVGDKITIVISGVTGSPTGAVLQINGVR